MRKEIISNSWLSGFISIKKIMVFFFEHHPVFQITCLVPLQIAKLSQRSACSPDRSDALIHLLCLVYPLSALPEALTRGNTDQLGTERRRLREEVKFWNLNWKVKWVSKQASSHGVYFLLGFFFFLDWNRKETVGVASDQAVSSKHFHHQMQFFFQFANLLAILLTFKEIPVQSQEVVLKNCIVNFHII